MKVPVSPRVLFRGWQESDLKPFAAMNMSPAVMEFFPSLISEEESRDMIHRLQQEIDLLGYGIWVLEDKQTGEFLGFTGLHHVTFQAHFTPCVEIGWRLRQECWGKGIATEAAKASLQYAKDVRGLSVVYSFTTLTNKRSERVMQKIGMVKIGEFEHPKVAIGHPMRPHVLYRTMEVMSEAQ